MSVNKSISEHTPAFIIPHCAEYEKTKKYFIADTLDGLFAQTDANWQAVIINDCSPKQEVRDYLNNIEEKFFPKIEVIFLNKNMGPGVCRNIGVLWALKRQCPIVLFNDADDISHPERVEVVKKIFLENPKIGLVYSTFKVIDENNQFVPIENIPSPTLEILESHASNPVEGDDAWIRIGTERGYTNITSSTAVRTLFAYECPFPAERASEDSHTWMRISASGACFKYTPLVPTRYRIPSYMKYQASRTRLGPSNFNKIKIRVDTDGFLKAIEIAVTKGRIKPEEIPFLKSKFYERLAQSMKREQEEILAKELLDKTDYFVAESLLYYDERC